MPRHRSVLTLVGAGLHVFLVSGCLGAAAGQKDLPLASDYLHEGDSKTLFDPNPQSAAPTPGRTTADRPPPPPPEKPAPKPVERAPEAIAPAPPPHDPPAVAALRAYLDNKPGAARAALNALLPVIASAGLSEMDSGPGGVDRVLEQIDLLTTTLRPRGSLALSKVCFTRHIEGFGLYEPLATPDSCPVFLSGLEGRPGERVQVYVEVQNLACRHVGPFWETAVASTVEIRSDSLVDDPNSRPRVMPRPARPDRSRSPRQDYFLNIQFHIPPRLPPGRYKMRVEVRDDITGRVQDRTLEFRVEAPR
jgi:hypothetical protein